MDSSMQGNKKMVSQYQAGPRYAKWLVNRGILTEVLKAGNSVQLSAAVAYYGRNNRYSHSTAASAECTGRSGRTGGYCGSHAANLRIIAGERAACKLWVLSINTANPFFPQLTGFYSDRNN